MKTDMTFIYLFNTKTHIRSMLRNKSCFLGHATCEGYDQPVYLLWLTLVLLNKLSLPHPFLTVNQSDNLMLFVIVIHELNEKQCRLWSDGFFRSHLIWIYTVFKGNAYPGNAYPGQGLIKAITSGLWVIDSFCRQQRLWSNRANGCVALHNFSFQPTAHEKLGDMESA